MGRSSGAIVVERNVPNAIINGGFEIWQRGTPLSSFPAATPTNTADRWLLQQNSTGAYNIAQDTADVPPVNVAYATPAASLRITATTGATGPGSSEYCFLRQCIEGFNWLPLTQRPIALSFWVKASVPGIYTIANSNSGQDRALIVE